MAKKRRSARKSKANPKRRRRLRRAAPRHTVARKSNPRRRRRARRAHASFARKSNPRRHFKRRRNPASAPTRSRADLKSLAIAGAVGVLGFLGVQAATYYATKDMITDGSKNRKLIGLVLAGVGIFVARKRPLMGAALVAGGVLGGFSDYLTLKLMQFMPVKQAAAPKVGAVAYDNLAALQYESAPQFGVGSLGAVAYDNLAGWETMGDPVPPPPWENAVPF